MLPSYYNYSVNAPRDHVCANCGNRWVAFHLGVGTSFCNLHKLRTQSPAYYTCGQWVQDMREKTTWTQNVPMAFRMPDMNTADFITFYSIEDCCPTCKNCDEIGNMYYCTKYFNELSGCERTCKMCQVHQFGKCVYYEKDR